MRKIFTFLVLLAFTITTVNAQQIWFSNESYSGWDEENVSSIYVKGKLFYTHPSDDKAIDLAWVASPNVPEGWEIGICDDTYCYNSLESEAGVSDFNIDVGDSLEVKILFTPNGIVGTGTVTLTISSASAGVVNATYELSVVSTDLQDVEQQTINIFPNPVISNLNIDVEGYNLSAIRIYNLTGKEVKHYELDAMSRYDLEYDLSDLNQGMYLISLEDETGAAIETRRFSKVN